MVQSKLFAEAALSVPLSQDLPLAAPHAHEVPLSSVLVELSSSGLGSHLDWNLCHAVEGVHQGASRSLAVLLEAVGASQQRRAESSEIVAVICFVVYVPPRHLVFRLLWSTALHSEPAIGCPCGTEHVLLA